MMFEKNMPKDYSTTKMVMNPIASTNGKLAVWVGGLRFYPGYPSVTNNPFQQGIPGIQTTGPQTTN